MTKEEIDMLERAIDTHTSALLRDADAYSKNGNTEAVKDCFAEVRNYNKLKEKIGKDV